MNYKKGGFAMKKVFIIVLCLCFLYSFSGNVLAQQKTQKNIQIDSTGTKQKTPSKQTRKQKAQVKKAASEKIELPKLKPWQDDRPLLMKEKDSLQRNAK
ncbi:MAG: hypothetical protein ABSC53_13145 [Bacteroidota bacterium]